MVFCESAPGDPLEEVLARFLSIEDRIHQIEAGQKEILARDETINAKLSEVRVWALRRQRLVKQS